MNLDPALDLTFSRTVDIAPSLVWRAWTEPAHVVHWFTPAPWKTVECEIDLRPGGLFRTVMRSPEGQDHANLGCFLEVVPERRLVWTNAMEPGFRPTRASSHLSFLFTATIELEPAGAGTLYRAAVLHADEKACREHAAMGFEEGWGKALDQLVEYMKRAG